MLKALLIRAVTEGKDSLLMESFFLASLVSFIAGFRLTLELSTGISVVLGLALTLSWLRPPTPTSTGKLFFFYPVC